MSTRKIVLIVVGILAVLALVGALFAGGIVWFALSAVSKSDAADAARTYLRANEDLKREIGNVTDFGWLVTGSIERRNTTGNATVELKVIGERKTVNATVLLVYRGSWNVTEAFYDNDGRKVVLKAPYEDAPPSR